MPAALHPLACTHQRALGLRGACMTRQQELRAAIWQGAGFVFTLIVLGAIAGHITGV